MMQNQEDSIEKSDSKALDESTNWEEVLNSIKLNKFQKEYSAYNLNKREYGYLIQKKNEKIFLFKEKKKVKIFLDSNTIQTIEIYSTMEIEKFIESKQKNINDLYIKQEEKKFVDIINKFGYFSQNKEFEIRAKKSIPQLKFEEYLEDDYDYKPEEYSEFFYDYFIYEDKKKSEEKIIFEKNKIRTIIFENIITLREENNLKTFKFTGPASIGKSLTLFRISRIAYNIAYINLKVLSDIKQDLYKSYCIIISELKRFTIDEKKINEIIQKSYNNENSSLNLLLNIMLFLSGIGDNFVFILDQYKSKYIFEEGFMEKVNLYNNIKLVICSSINNKNIRDECIKTWTFIGKKTFYLNVNNQSYYFYFTKIYKNKSKNDNLRNDNIFNQISFIPKYIQRYNALEKDKNKFFNEIKNQIDKKIKEFCEDNKLKKSDLLINLKYLINKEYSYSDFSLVIQFVPLKYFIINFKSDNFKIKPIFPFMYNIVNYKLKESECDNYFKNKMYSNNSIENKYVKGDYFEAATKFGLLKLKFPKKDNYIETTLNEIVSMDKIILPDEIKEDYEEEKSDTDEEISQIYEPIKIKNNDKNNEINMKEIDNINSGVEPLEFFSSVEFEDSEDDKGNDDIIEEKEEKNDINIDNKEESNLDEDDKNEGYVDNDFERMLKKFGIESNENNLNEEGFSYKAILYSQTIEDYRNYEIKEQRKKYQENDEPIKKSNFNGDESLFLDQYSKWGKALDFAYMYGPKDKKTFVGFQMKCYFEDSNLNNNAVDKCWIRYNCKKILVNSMKLFNCKIVKWHYYLIFYYNFSNNKSNVNIKNLDKCRDNNISYFFYDPEKKFFLDKANHIMDELKIKNESNLDAYVTDVNTVKYTINFSGEAFKTMKDDFKKDFSILFSLDNPTINEILTKIGEKLEIKNLKFHAKCEKESFSLYPLKKNETVLYKMKNSNDFIAVTYKKGKTKYYRVSSGKKLKYLYESLDEESSYYYILYKERKLKTSKIPAYFRMINK